MDTPAYAEYIKSRKEPNPVFLEVFQQMTKNGELEGLSDEEALERVVSATEQIMENA
jgi:hypothetical protein